MSIQHTANLNQTNLLWTYTEESKIYNNEEKEKAMKMIFHMMIPASLSSASDLKRDYGMDAYRRIEYR